MGSKRRTLTIFLSLLALFLLGTVAVLSTISFYLRIDPQAYITETELSNSTDRSAERIPRIIHQTWKTEVLPERWRNVSQVCRGLMPDYEYMLWTDTLSREFIATHYSWFLPTFDAYPYPIQRADAIRYFVLHRFGGVYLDLDVGCLRPLDPLLVFPVILPKTIPVGVSNDIMFAAKGHPFMEQTIHNLVTFDHSYVLNYPTVMFSTGPMFLSAQFGIYMASHPSLFENPYGDIRILPKSLYGKNAKPDEAPNSFFEHYYGSSWHADDAAFITFLGKWGKMLMWLGLVVFVFGVIRLFWQRHMKNQHYERRWRRFTFGRYDVVLPRAFQRDGRFHVDLGFVTMSEPSGATTEPTSPISSYCSGPPSPTEEQRMMPVDCEESLLPSGLSSEASLTENTSRSISTIVVRTLRQAGRWIRTSVAGSPESLPPSRRRRSLGVMFFLPAIFTPSSRTAPGGQYIPLINPQIPHSTPRSRSGLPFSSKDSEDMLLSRTGVYTPDFVRARSPAAGSSTTPQPPPPYERRGETSVDWMTGEGAWGEWTGDGETRP